jgi:Uncharacterized protein conserved in bacteria
MVVKSNRELNYDLLRIVCMIAVITIHVSARYIDLFWLSSNLSNVNTQNNNLNIQLACFYYVCSRWAVPCFLMLSGAFDLSNSSNSDCRYFYKKVFINIGVPTVIFSFLYFIYSEILAFLSVLFKGADQVKLLVPLKNALIGSPFYHMWYMYTFIGAIIFVPFIIILMSNGEAMKKHVLLILLVWASASEFTSRHMLKWDLGSVVCYLVYFLVGYKLRQLSIHKKKTWSVLLMIIGSIGILIVLSFVYYHGIMTGGDRESYDRIIAPFSPIIVIVSVMMFYAFSNLNINRFNCTRISSCSFYIYLFHAGVWDVIQRFIAFSNSCSNTGIIILFCVIIVFVISTIMAITYIHTWNIFEKHYNISKKLCLLFKLE